MIAIGVCTMRGQDHSGRPQYNGYGVLCVPPSRCITFIAWKSFGGHIGTHKAKEMRYGQVRCAHKFYQFHTFQQISFHEISRSKFSEV